MSLRKDGQIMMESKRDSVDPELEEAKTVVFK